MKRALVRDAGQRRALAVTRSLGGKSVLVFTSEEAPRAQAACSRHSKQFFSYPSPWLHPDRFIEALFQLVNKQHMNIPAANARSLLDKVDWHVVYHGGIQGGCGWHPLSHGDHNKRF